MNSQQDDDVSLTPGWGIRQLEKMVEKILATPSVGRNAEIIARIGNKTNLSS